MILITGGTGFIGRLVVKRLLDSGNKVRCLALPGEKVQKHKNLSVVRGDVTDKDAVKKAVRGCQKIIHLAAILDSHSPLINKVNITGTKNLVDAAKEFKIKKFIFASTENVLPKQKDAYADTKKKAENIVKSLKQHVILRFTAVYGRSCRGNIHKLLGVIKNHTFIPVIGSGNYLFQPLHVVDVVHYLLKSLKYGQGTFIIAGPNPVSMNEFINTASGVLGKRTIKIHIPFFLIKIGAIILAALFKRPPISPVTASYLVMDRKYNMSRTIKLLKHQPVVLEKGLKHTYKI